MIPIPTSTTDRYWTQVTTFEGVDYQLSFRYSDRESCYYLQFSDLSGNVLLMGVKLVSNFPLLRSVIDPALPRGELYAITMSSDDSPARFGELDADSGRVGLWYATEAELVGFGKETWRFPGFLV